MRQLRVWITADDPGLRLDLVGSVARAGHRPEPMAFDAELFARLREAKPDLLLLDFADQDQARIDFLGRLVRHGLQHRTPVIGLSPRAELEYELLELFDFLPPPPDPTRLQQSLALLASSPAAPPSYPDRLPEAAAAPFEEYLERHTGLHFERRNRRQLERGLLSRLRAVRISGFDDYLQYLRRYQEDRRELKKLLSLLTIGETNFFRYRSDREALVQEVLPELVEKRRGRKSLRIWSAGCSTGEEPYSLAILLLEHFPELTEWRIDILATDINKRSLRHARQGIYGPHALRLTARPYREKYFSEVAPGLHLVHPQVRRMVRFAYLNLQEESYPDPATGLSELDLLFCRNVLIYFRRETTRRVLERFHRCLRPDGFLFLGHAETLAGLGSLFDRHHRQGAFFYQPAGRQERPAPDRSTSRPEPPVSAVPSVSPPLSASGATASAPSQVASAGELLAAARQAFDREEFTRAEALFEQILQQQPGHLEALVGMGLIRANQGRYDEARRLAARAIRQDDLSPHPYLLRGLILEMEGEPERAAVEFQKVLWLQMESVVARYHLAKVHLRCGRQREAARETRTVIRHLERLPAETVIPFSGGLSREVFLEICREDLGRLPAGDPVPDPS